MIIASPNRSNSWLVTIQGQVVGPAFAGQDNLQAEGTESIGGQIQEDADWAAVVNTADNIVSDINRAQTEYTPRTNNSNRLAGDVYEGLTGEQVSDDNAERAYPGLEGGDLPRCARGQDPC